jgi:L-rhamnose isomerase
MKYEEALLAAESLLETIHENNIKDKTDVMWLISNIYLFMDNGEQSYEWAKKAHELTADTPNDKSHQAFLSRAIRTGRIDESFGEIIEYRKIHPVIVSDWMKEIQMPEEATGEELIRALNEATGYSHEDYEEIENQFVSLYKTNLFMPNSVVLRHYGMILKRYLKMVFQRRFKGHMTA